MLWKTAELHPHFCLRRITLCIRDTTVKNPPQLTLKGIFHAADGGRTRTLSPERDFKSLVSANFTTVAHRNPAYKALLLWTFTESRE